MKNIFPLLIHLICFSSLFAQTSITPCPDTPTVIYGNKTYNTVQIGEQCWLKENIDIGTRVNGIIDQTNNGVLEKYCYEDDPSNCEKYGALYTWNEAMKYSTGGGKVQGICPSGWHIPTLEELSVLKSFVNNDGNSLKEIGQGQGEGIGAGTNTSGFSAMLAGSRGYGGHFSHQKVYLWLWSSDDINEVYTNVLELDYSNNGILLYSNGKEAAFSVRCIKGEGVTSISDKQNFKNRLPEFSLSQNYPNPFNPNTRINFSLRESGNVVLKIFDILGKEIETLVNENKQAGSYSIDYNASHLTNGIYFYKLSTGGFIEIRKMVLIK